MNIVALRVWGIVVSAALIAASLMIARFAPAFEARAQGVYETAQAQTPAVTGPVAFIVRFQGTGPIARAQMLAARGQTSRAQQQIEMQLRRQSAFNGLCFDRFTVGGAEVVLRSCGVIAAHERNAVQQTWLNRLRAMRSVAYADANATATQGRAG